MRKEPKKIKLTDAPTAASKEPQKIPMNSFDITMYDDIYIRPDNDSIYIPIVMKNNENNSQNNS